MLVLAWRSLLVLSMSKGFAKSSQHVVGVDHLETQGLVLSQPLESWNSA